MVSGPITTWQIEGEKVEGVTDFTSLGSKITAYGDRNHEIQRSLFLGRKTIRNLDSALKSRDVTLLTKVCTVKAMVFPGVMDGCDIWTIKKAEHKRTNAFELCWRRVLRVPWTARRSNQSILKEINQSWIFIGRIDVEVPILWSSDTKSRLIGKRHYWWEKLRAGGQGGSRGWDG